MTISASVASIHLRPINESRRRCGLAPLTADDVEHEFAAVAHLPVRTKGSTRPTGTNQASADSMWGGIITKLNASLSSSRAPIGARWASPVPANTQPTARLVDWSEIATGLNEQAGLKTPVRTNAR
jgi:hypothetical protein